MSLIGAQVPVGGRPPPHFARPSKTGGSLPFNQRRHTRVAPRCVGHRAVPGNLSGLMVGDGEIDFVNFLVAPRHRGDERQVIGVRDQVTVDPKTALRTQITSLDGITTGRRERRD